MTPEFYLPFILTGHLSRRVIEDALSDTGQIKRTYDNAANTGDLILMRMLGKLRLVTSPELWAAKLLFCLDQARKDFTECERLVITFSNCLISSGAVNATTAPDTLVICSRKFEKHAKRFAKLASSSLPAAPTPEMTDLFICYLALTFLIVFLLERAEVSRLTKSDMKGLCKIFNSLIQRRDTPFVTESSSSDSSDDPQSSSGSSTGSEVLSVSSEEDWRLEPDPKTLLCSFLSSDSDD